MKRLVYAPKVNAWVKSDSGIIDLSDYIISGNVSRVVNEVSSATLTFRNPKKDDGNLLFTEHKMADGTLGPLLHPQDPIIITLTRLKGRPIQVFTGYCDKTPYLQLYPGPVSLEASCTLKRLQYTYFDAGLPFTQEFLRSYGWFPDAAHGGISAPTAQLQQLTGQTNLTDGSLGRLLLGVLEDLGGWDESTVYIEPLPAQIGTLVANLFQQFQESAKENKEVQSAFSDLLSNLIGSDSQGSGGGGGASSGGADPKGGHGKGSLTLAQFNAYAQPAAKKYGLKPSLLFAICEIETGFGSNRNVSSAGAIGLMQFEPSTARGLGIDALDDKQAVFGAARYLKQNGAMADLHKAIFAYNHADWYVAKVMAGMAKYARFDN